MRAHLGEAGRASESFSFDFLSERSWLVFELTAARAEWRNRRLTTFDFDENFSFRACLAAITIDSFCTFATSRCFPRYAFCFSLTTLAPTASTRLSSTRSCRSLGGGAVLLYQRASSVSRAAHVRLKNTEHRFVRLTAVGG